ncbi:MAG: XTP/dITP diphosphatase [Candidatus Micrarchaeaceae archaeon]
MHMNEINFVTSNRNKFEEIKLLGEKRGIKVNWLNQAKFEIQSYIIDSIAELGAIAAFSALLVPLIVEDTGLFIDSLNGFPGPYAAQVYKSVGLNGVLKLLEGARDRSARFETVICYASESDLKLFKGVTKGTIANSISNGRNFGYDPIFIPEGKEKTLAELGIDEKNKLSHRAKAFNAFADYFLEKDSY